MSQLENTRTPTPLKLSALWTAATFCYLYCDYFELYVPGKLQSMLAGRMEPLGPVTQTALMGPSVLMAIPSVLIALCLLLPPVAVRYLNLAVAAFFTLMMAAFVVWVDWHFYQFFALVETCLTGTIFWVALKWPKCGVPHP
ncbi:DUF6326 family protein [Paucibacter sp. Y2R2-4]|uniref:DUF6326 family protein n=1 Tax=Paucibacter sp. Y2R2-4 TaxID=2893553 RepID=UPI0021E480E5|nr:DUF6326 family protein [Paucibacter sp. Y2R2-4]MCV2351525.1 DUF6326 family protein [Paucibacter sp. Y2R2-4]